jgi:acetyltransferase
MADSTRHSGLVDPGALLATTHAVGEGSRVRLRLARPTDGEGVRAFLEALSPESRRRRFLAPVPSIGERLVRHFTFFKPRERLVVAAVSAEEDGEQIVGLGDVAVLSTGLAELGLLVAEEWRGRGVGGLLTEAVASLARQRGATHLKAELLEENEPMLRLIERLGPTVRTHEHGVTLVYARLPAGRRRAA